MELPDFVVVVSVRVVVKFGVERLTSGKDDNAGALGFDPVVVPSPSLTSDAMALSRSPFSPFKTLELRLSSGNPISFKVTNFHSKPSSVTPILAPNTLDCLLIRIGEGIPEGLRYGSGDKDGESSERLETGRADEADRNPNLKRLEGFSTFSFFGGGGGGSSSEPPVKWVIGWRETARGGWPESVFESYF